jgi:hypothetical protein
VTFLGRVTEPAGSWFRRRPAYPVSLAADCRADETRVFDRYAGWPTSPSDVRERCATFDSVDAISSARPHPEEGAFAPVSKDVATWFETRSERSAPHHEGWRMGVADGDNSGKCGSQDPGLCCHRNP